jgi:hypothetical protein
MIVIRDGKAVQVAVESAVDDRTLALVDEFTEHWETMHRRHGKEIAQHWSAERSTAFEGWALQKIAGLQLAVEHLTAVLSAVDKEMKARANAQRQG